MDNDERSYEPVHVDMIGIEDGFERFAKDGIAHLPPVAGWRNNLTALSQQYNLFFIASSSRIAVFQPDFPFQTLRSQYALLITPDLKNPQAHGHISSHRDGEDDHCINHIRVGSLGSQEVLVLATDSGNVSAYHTSAIVDAIHRASDRDSVNNTAELLGLRPFFSDWVQQSAWGIDIHKDARMIAVSANRPDPNRLAVSGDSMATVTVFAFALTPVLTTDSDSDESSSPLPAAHGHEYNEWQLWSVNTAADTPLRDRNYKIVLAGYDAHRHNIPNISFANSDNSSSCWILSADITGFMKIWDIWRMQCIRTWFFGSTEGVPRPWLDHQYPGWNVIALDTTCFRLAHTNDEFIGAAKAPMYQGYMDRGRSYNLTNVVRRLATNGPIHPSNTEVVDEEFLSDNESIHSNAVLDDDNETQNDIEADNDTDTELDDQIQSPIEPRSLGPDLSHIATDYSAGGSRDIERFDRSIIFNIESESESEEESSDEEDLESLQSDSPQSPPVNQQASRVQRHIRQRVTPLQNENMDLPNVAMIHCSDSHVRLLTSPRAKFPHWFCADMLKQILPQNVDTNIQGFNFAHMDRLIMHHSIPDLGVLLIATQAGRVAVCALTRHPTGLLGMRVDCILPTRRQERKGRRPEFCTLVGLAVSPIQGRAEPPDESEFTNSTRFSTSAESGGTKIDGVDSTFDDEVVVLNGAKRVQRRGIKKMRRSDKGSSSTSREDDDIEGPEIEKRPWLDKHFAGSGIGSGENWKATENSRRYRLMLTFSDLTVLTYEISRDVDRNNIL